MKTCLIFKFRKAKSDHQKCRFVSLLQMYKRTNLNQSKTRKSKKKNEKQEEKEVLYNLGM